MDSGNALPISKSIQTLNLVSMTFPLPEDLSKADSNFNRLKWHVLQNYAYIAYLINFRFVLESQECRKRIKVFKHISKLIKTRKPNQIKSHHQKMLIKYKNIDSIIQNVRNKIQKAIEKNEDLVQLIDRVDQQAELFFIEERLFAQELYEKRDVLGYKPVKSQVKLEEEQQVYPNEAKCSQFGLLVNEGECLKQEDSEDMLIRYN